MEEYYDGLTWEVEDTPFGSSTPDDNVEFSHLAATTCPNCGSRINGTAQYWSDRDITWLERIDYKECECEDDLYEWDDDEWDDEDDEFEGGISVDPDLVKDFIEVVQTNQKFKLND